MITISLKNGVTVPAMELDKNITLVTPELAQALLAQNNENIRRISDKRVIELARDMTQGRWRDDSGDIIVITKGGKIKDGQHRLAACIKSGKNFKVHFVYSEKDSNLDYHVKASFSDLMSFKGYSDATQFGTAARTIMRYEKSEGIKGKNPAYEAFSTTNEVFSNWERYKFIKADGRDKKLIKSIEYARPYATKATSNISLSSLASLHYILSRKNKKLADELIKVVGTPLKNYKKLGISAGDPVRSLKKFLEEDVTAKKGEKASLKSKLARFIKTWNCWKTDKLVKNIIWKSSGENAEPFPKIL
jgi:hypothetical protein